METPNHILEMELRRLKARVSTLEEQVRVLVETADKQDDIIDRLVWVVNNLNEVSWDIRSHPYS